MKTNLPEQASNVKPYPEVDSDHCGLPEHKRLKGKVSNEMSLLTQQLLRVALETALEGRLATGQVCHLQASTEMFGRQLRVSVKLRAGRTGRSGPAADKNIRHLFKSPGWSHVWFTTPDEMPAISGTGVVSGWELTVTGTTAGESFASAVVSQTQA